MSSATFVADRAAPPPARATGRLLPALSLPALLLFAALLIALNPIVYRGGDGDDWHYLEAARCAVGGACLPIDHWWSRLPLVAPVGAMLAVFGESLPALAIVPLLYAVTGIGFFVIAAQRQFGRAEGLLAGFIFIATPVVSERLIHLNVDLPEFAFLAGAAFCLQTAARNGGRRRWSAAAGLMLALAIQTRATSLAALPLFAAGLWLMPQGRRHMLPFLTVLASVPLLQGLIYLHWTGDFLHHWRLQTGHVRIPSTELSASVDTSKSPLFNLAYIAGWKPATGISVHWTVNAVLNLLAHPAIGLTLSAALALLIVRGRRLMEAGGRPLLFLVAAAALMFAALVFGLAVDPKPRMFIPLAAAASLCVGIFVAQSWRAGDRILPVALMALIIGKGAILAYDAVKPQPALDLAARWIEEEGPALAIEDRSRRFLALVPPAAALPDRGDRLLLIGVGGCNSAARDAGLTGWRPVRAEVFPRPEPAIIAGLRERRLFFGPRETPALCIFDRA